MVKKKTSHFDQVADELSRRAQTIFDGSTIGARH